MKKKKILVYFIVFAIFICSVVVAKHFYDARITARYKLALQQEQQKYSNFTLDIYHKAIDNKDYDSLCKYFNREPNKKIASNDSNIVSWFLDGHYEVDAYLDKDNKVTNLAYRQYFYNVDNTLNY